MKIDLAPRPRRRMNLTPLIDVVFLLLVFFMMVSRFGAEQAVPLRLASATGGAAAWSGPPRLISLSDRGIALNGAAVSLETLVPTLSPLMAQPGDPVVVRLEAGSDVQDLMAVMDRLKTAGIVRLAVLQ